jgi:hypothetical protein
MRAFASMSRSFVRRIFVCHAVRWLDVGYRAVEWPVRVDIGEFFAKRVLY